MTQRHLSRRILVGGTSAALLLGAVGFLPLLGSASAAGCPSWTDPKGDSTTGQFGIPGTEDAQMDILSSSFSVVGDSVVATVTTDALSNSSTDAGDEFGVNFTVAGQSLTMYADRTAPGGAPINTSAGLLNNTSDAPLGVAEVAYDVAKKTVTLKSKLSEVATVATKPVAGQVVSALSTYTSDAVYVLPMATYDDSATTLTTPLTADCGGGTGPAPTTSPTPSASPNPTPTSSTPPPASTGDPAKDLPKAGCVTQADVKGDSKFAGNGPNDPDIDLTGLILRTTPTELVAYLGVDKLAAGPMTTDGHRFTLGFTFNKHNFAAAGSAYKNGSGGIKDGIAETGQFSHVTQLSVDGGGSVVPDPFNPTADKGFKTSGLKVTFDVVNSRVVFQLPIADIVKYDGGVPFAGEMTAVLGTAATDNWASSSPADYVSKDNTSTSTVKWTIGNNSCFAPPPAVLANTGVSKVQYGDSAGVAAKLTNTSGAAMAGRKVTFSLAGKTATATSGADGVAKSSIPVSVLAGATTLGISFAGDATADKVALSVPFTVVEEKTKLSLTVQKKGNARTVAITLLDDDKHGVAAQKVAVYVNGKLVSTLTTNGAGKVSFTKGNPTQTVKVVFKAVAGKYLGSTAQAKL